jgi:hypothetical protein
MRARWAQRRRRKAKTSGNKGRKTKNREAPPPHAPVRLAHQVVRLVDQRVKLLAALQHLLDVVRHDGLDLVHLLFRSFDLGLVWLSWPLLFAHCGRACVRAYVAALRARRTMAAAE